MANAASTRTRPETPVRLEDLREERESFEQRLKAVDVWVEPDSVTADA